MTREGRGRGVGGGGSQGDLSLDYVNLWIKVRFCVCFSALFRCERRREREIGRKKEIKRLTGKTKEQGQIREKRGKRETMKKEEEYETLEGSWEKERN